jgi:hypothetical protein
MLRDYGPAGHRLICITDMPKGVTECPTYPLWPSPVPQLRERNCFARLKLFHPGHALRFGKRLVSIDLDAVILRDIQHLFTNDDFRAVRGISAPLNGSMWMTKVGCNQHVWDTFQGQRSVQQIRSTRHNGRRICGSDQAWMSIQLPGAPTWDEEDGVAQYLGRETDPSLEAARIVFFAGRTKPWDRAVEGTQPRIYNHYQRYLQCSK